MVKVFSVEITHTAPCIISQMSFLAVGVSEKFPVTNGPKKSLGFGGDFEFPDAFPFPNISASILNNLFFFDLGGYRMFRSIIRIWLVLRFLFLFFFICYLVLLFHIKKGQDRALFIKKKKK